MNSINDNVNNLFKDISEYSGFLDDIFEHKNIGIFTGRNTGKSYLSSFIILKYLNSLDKNVEIFRLDREIIVDKINFLGCLMLKIVLA